MKCACVCVCVCTCGCTRVYHGWKVRCFRYWWIFFFNVLCVDAIALECVCKQIYKPVYMKSVYVFVCVRVCSCISQEKEELSSILVDFDVLYADAIDSVCKWIYMRVYMKCKYVFVRVRVRVCISQVKEALFSILVEFDVLRADAIALDTFSGCGSVGIEALSRGMSYMWHDVF